MNEYKIVIVSGSGIHDSSGGGIKHDIADLGIKGIESVHASQLYMIRGPIEINEVMSLGSNLLADPITQKFIVEQSVVPAEGTSVVEVWLKPGVTDAVGESALAAAGTMGITTIAEIKTGTRYAIRGTEKLSRETVETICRKLLCNSVIQTYIVF